MMKRLIGMLVVTAVVALVLVGCGGSQKVDTAGLEKSFSSAETTLKASADKAIAAIKSADYKPALEELTKLAGNAKLTDEQKQAIAAVIEGVQKIIAEQVSKAAGEANKAAGEANKALEGLQKK